MRIARVLGTMATVALPIALVVGASGSQADEPQPLAARAVVTPQQATDFLALEAQHLSDGALADAGMSPGLYYPDDDGPAVIRVFADQEREGRAVVSQRSARSSTSTEGVSVEPSRYTAAQLAELSDAVDGITIPAGAAIGAAYEAADDMYVLRGDVDPAVVAAAMPNLPYEYVAGQQGGRDSRTNDTAPHAGGASIKSGSTTCTAAFAVKVSGAKRMVTAGHCGAIGASFQSQTGGNSFGSVTHRASFPTYDLELLSGSTYRKKIYTSSTATTKVESAGDPGVGSTYCFSGATSGVQCSATVTSKSGKLCDSAGCTQPVIAFTGSTPSGGDSGAPFYANSTSGGTATVLVRGVVIGHAGSVGYAELWSRVVDRFGATIVAG